MFALGALYLFFEKSILANVDSDETAEAKVDDRSRMIMGAQVSAHVLHALIDSRLKRHSLDLYFLAWLLLRLVLGMCRLDKVCQWVCW